MAEFLLPHLPADEIRAAFNRSPGNEVGREKVGSPESSAALAANFLGLFLDHPAGLPPLPGLGDVTWPPLRVAIEESARFPWSGGRHPWLDAVIETPSHLIGVEAKRYEPFRGGRTAGFSAAYARPVWGERMAPFEAMRDRLAGGTAGYRHLDAAQLVKHAFGLRTEAGRERRGGKRPMLVYLYAEPEAWPDGRPVGADDRARHAAEASAFAEAVAGAEVVMRLLTYRQLLAALRASPDEHVRDHADALAGHFPGSTF